MIRLPKFTAADQDQAYASWGCNCGPGALAAILEITLDDARALLPGFDAKKYTNPTMMTDALKQSGRWWSRRPEPTWPRYGLVRVQWEGPWTRPGVPMRARYRYTHWVGAAHSGDEVGVFDINCIANGTGWAALDDWTGIIVPHLTSGYPRADGKWHITHALEVGA